jgi:hypothetical protein
MMFYAKFEILNIVESISQMEDSEIQNLIDILSQKCPKSLEKIDFAMYVNRMEKSLETEAA